MGGHTNVPSIPKGLRSPNTRVNPGTPSRAQSGTCGDQRHVFSAPTASLPGGENSCSHDARQILQTAFSARAATHLMKSSEHNCYQSVNIVLFGVTWKQLVENGETVEGTLYQLTSRKTSAQTNHASSHNSGRCATVGAHTHRSRSSRQPPTSHVALSPRPTAVKKDFYDSHRRSRSQPFLLFSRKMTILSHKPSVTACGCLCLI